MNDCRVDLREITMISLLQKSLVLTLVVLNAASGAPWPKPQHDEDAFNGERISACLHSCHVCEQMYGDHFEAHICAGTCRDLKGRLPPDCGNYASIAPYLDLTNMLLL